MISFTYILVKWSEVWALLIPLAVLLKYAQPNYIRPVIIYLILALLLNITADIIMTYNRDHKTAQYSNNYLYNIHSVVRYVLFTIFLFRIQPANFINKFLSVITFLWLLYNFIFLEDFFAFAHISSRLFATEAGVLLIYCLQYYLYNMLNEKIKAKNADLWIVTGLSIYVVFNFPFFLLYTSLISKHLLLNKLLWDFHNITYVLLCIFIARGFYVAGNK